MQNEHLQILKQYWGYDSFRHIQEDIINSVASGKDTLGLMPTGGGKSICFQVPALAMDGLCIVVTPLIALMKDQVDHLRRNLIKAEAIYSGLTREDIVRRLDNCILGRYKFLYVSPERLETELFLAKVARIPKVSMLVVDEAHCISQWGYDFRPSYLKIANLRKYIGQDVPVLALTASATPVVTDDIMARLNFRAKNVFRMSFARNNLIYVVRHTENKQDDVLHIVRSIPQGSVIIYVRNREMTFLIAELLRNNGITAENYHAGLSDTEKDLRQANWMKGTSRVMVATNAFGMGIDKPDVRLVLHYGTPDSIEEYYQEAGRAGRDGMTSYAVLLADSSDEYGIRRRVNTAFPAKEYVKQTYENVCCFLNIGESEGEGQTFRFDLEKYCTRFRQFPVTVSNALHLLTAAGYIVYNEETNLHSMVHIAMQRDQLYDLAQLDRPEKNKVMDTMMRLFTGLFADYEPISEEEISKSTGLSVDAVYETLKSLGRDSIIEYIPQQRTPLITFCSRRIDTKYLNISEEIYEDRRDSYAERINRMHEYFTSTDKCRPRMIIEYFGESTKTDCGRCDYCIMNKHTTKNRSRRTEHKSQITDNRKTD